MSITNEEKFADMLNLSARYAEAINDLTPHDTEQGIMLGALGIVMVEVLSKWRERGGCPGLWIETVETDLKSRMS